MRSYGWLTLLLIASPLHAGQGDAALIQAEQRDAHAREQQELNSRIADLEQQAHTIESLADKQTEYIETLQAKINALQSATTESQP